MHTAASSPPREGFRKRRSSGNFSDKKTSCENGGSKLGLSRRKNKVFVTEMSSLGSVMDDSGVLRSPLKSPDEKKAVCSSGKNKGDRGLGFDGKKMGNRKKCNTDGNPGSKLQMGNVTILKRGEKIEDFVGNRSSDEEEVKMESVVNCGQEGVFVREEKKAALEQGKVFPAKKPMPVKKTKIVARVSQVCPVASFSEMNLRDAEIDKGGNREEDEFVKRLGPDPSVLSKEVGSTILGCVSLGSRISETSSDDESSKRNLGTDFNVKSASIPFAIPQAVEYSNRGFMFEKWAGPAYANSPSPACLPLPKFFVRQKVRPNTPEEGIDIKRSEIPESPIQEKEVQTAVPVERSNVSVFGHGGFDVFATRNLRRMLQLE